MDSTNPTQALCELAAAYALGALTTEEVHTFQEHLDAGCNACESEIEALKAVVADLSLSAAPSPPPPASLRARILERIAAESALAEPATFEKDGLLFSRSAKIDWRALPITGLDIKPLSIDPARGVVTQLVRMQPGAIYPSHRHAGVEELFLLEGDLRASGVVMHAGDYCRADPGSVHSDVTTIGGCLFISSTSVNDELFV